MLFGEDDMHRSCSVSETETLSLSTPSAFGIQRASLLVMLQMVERWFGEGFCSFSNSENDIMAESFILKG